MYTAIFTGDNTTLDIETTEELHLLQMGRTEPPIVLTAGTNHVPVGAGVFKIVSEHEITVTPNANIEVSATNDKNGNWPEPKRIQRGVDRAALNEFFADAKGYAVHRGTSK